jgi:uncharacterized lipoprotein
MPKILKNYSKVVEKINALAPEIEHFQIPSSRPKQGILMKDWQPWATLEEVFT